jgi:hypothetical protein
VGAWPAFTNQQVADAKARACAAYTTVRTGVSLQTHATGAADPVATPAVAVDARLSEVVSAQYLLNRLDPVVLSASASFQLAAVLLPSGVADAAI